MIPVLVLHVIIMIPCIVLVNLLEEEKVEGYEIWIYGVVGYCILGIGSLGFVMRRVDKLIVPGKILILVIECV